MPITVQLDRPREIRWTMLAKVRNASLDKPVWFDELANRKRGLYVMCALIWAGLVDRDHGFAQPEDLAAHFDTPEKQTAAHEAVWGMAREAGLLKESKKNETPGTPPSPTGASLSSSSGSPPSNTTH